MSKTTSLFDSAVADSAVNSELAKQLAIAIDQRIVMHLLLFSLSRLRNLRFCASKTGPLPKGLQW
jgi:hypothetical protein